MVERSQDGSNFFRSCYEIAISIFLYILSFVILVYASNYYIIATAMLLMAFSLVRLFIIQHDCGHRNLFKQIKTNDTVGLLLSVITLFPYHYWRKSHNYHHAHTGVEGEISIGSIEMLTVKEYRFCKPFEKFVYRLTRAPLFLLGIVPALLFLIIYRSPYMAKKTGKIPPILKKRDWFGLYKLNAAILIIYGMIFFLFGALFLLKCLISMYFAVIIGVVLFYVQHNYKEAYNVKKEHWSHSDAALKGTSLILLPGILNWFTGSIGYHYLHHLKPKIPFYRLKKVHCDSDKINSGLKVIRLKDIFSQFKFKLYDESSNIMITWKEYKETSG